MEVYVKPTREDLFAYNMFYLRHSKETRAQIRKARIARIVVIIILVAILVAGIRAAGLLASWNSTLLVFALLSVMYIILCLATESRQLKRRVQRLTEEGNQRAALSPRTFKLTENAVSYDGELTGGWTKWEAVDDVQETQEHIFILLSARMAYIIPKAAFTTPVDAQQFVEAARRFKAESGPMGRGASAYRKVQATMKETESGASHTDAASVQTIPGGERDPAQEKDDSAFGGWS